MKKCQKFYWLLFFILMAGCPEKKANTEGEIKLRGIPEEYLPFAFGDVVLLKPDRLEAVITNIDSFDSCGLYRVKYSPNGRKFVEKKFIKIVCLKYKVRYRVTQELPKSYVLKEDEPTQLTHYQERFVHWYEIQEKKE